MKCAGDLVTREVITVTPTTPITEVARVLTEHEISGCPVVDVNGRLRGIISRTDILQYALTTEGGALTPVLRVFIPGTEEEEEVVAPLGEDYEVAEAQDVMSTDVVTVKMDTPLHEVARILFEERIHRVPVMDGGRVGGILTSLDLLGAFPRSANPPATGAV